MKRLIILFLITLSACSTQKPKQEPAPLREKSDPLTELFRLCESDLERASDVIVEKDIVKNLSHLQRMNAGGKHYYLLERENISGMINAVTRGMYADYVLVNRSGAVIYTRDNNDIFSKNVRAAGEASALKVCYDNRDRRIFLSDVTRLSSFEGKEIVLASRMVSGKESFPGILILEIDIDRILEALEPGSFIIGMDGNYRITRDRSRINTPFPFFSEIDRNALSEKDGMVIPGRRIWGRIFNFHNLSWIVLREEQAAQIK
jgi:hypothetical protein